MSAGRTSVSPDEVVRRYVERVRAEIQPDPLFRRRLRGVVTNQFVAAREGLGSEPVARGRSRMGALGRACLYASFALGVSVGGVMAASRAALPGDLLYPVKLQIEALRAEALPAQFQDDLALLALSERIYEMSQLAESGDWAAAAALAPAVEAGYEQLEALGVGDMPGDEAVEHRMEVLEALRDQLPPSAQAVIDRVLAHEPGSQGSALDVPRAGERHGPGTPANGHGRGGVPATTDGIDSQVLDEPVRTTPPTPTPRPTPTARPAPTPRLAPHQPSPSAATAEGDGGTAQPEDDAQD